VAPHPFGLPLLAVSGIDDDAKLVAPGPDASPPPPLRVAELDAADDAAAEVQAGWLASVDVVMSEQAPPEPVLPAWALRLLLEQAGADSASEEEAEEEGDEGESDDGSDDGPDEDGATEEGARRRALDAAEPEAGQSAPRRRVG